MTLQPACGRAGSGLASGLVFAGSAGLQHGREKMAKGQVRKQKEAKKPKKEKPKVLATAGLNNPAPAVGKKK
jgi:hypothetical protein